MNCLIGLSLIFASITPEEDSCTNNCNSEFGSTIGESYLTKAYSNCHGDCLKLETNFVSVKNRQIPSGLKWQCVEYARRWLIENKGITFAPVKYAYQIWDLHYGTQVETNAEVPLLKCKNKISKTAPEVGDLLIYSDAFAITGHVSVIVGVAPNSVTIGEQNYFNAPWDGGNYSRRLLLDKSPDGTYRIFDDCLLGWVRFASP
ncbi:MAG: CHAP domain-containing protein [Chlamydiae bacterium]|nr:CHAP domain-containing protein [Chlamydiota bacterium]